MGLLDCEVIPRSTATSEQLRALGGALAVWARHESADIGILHFISRGALVNLANGNPPPSFFEQYQEMLNEARALMGDVAALGAEQQQQERKKLRETLGETSARRTLFFQVRGSYATRARIFANLRENIPADLVDDVVVAGRSWDNG